MSAPGETLAADPADHASHKALQNSRALRWALGLGAAAMALIGVVLILLLTVATTNRERYEQLYGWLFGTNLVVSAVLGAVILWAAVRLALRLKRGKFGSRLLIKLAAIFAIVGFLPGVVIYIVSYQFVSRSIESWFDVRVEGALDAGLNLGRVTLDTLSLDLANKSRAAAQQLSDVPDASAGVTLERVREQIGAEDVSLWTSTNQLIGSVGSARFALNPERPPAALARKARSQRVATVVEGLDEAPVNMASNARIKALAVVTPGGMGLLAEPRLLQVTVRLPPSLVANAIAVQEANREYQERALARQGLKRMYIATLTLSLFFSVFGAVLLAAVFGNQLARPLLLIAAGVREVAAGDLSPKPALATRDELGGLTRSFAQMTQQLADARGQVEKSMGQVSAARANLQTILDNLTAGVVVLDAQGSIRSANAAATRVLRVPLAAHVGQPLAQVPGLEVFATAVLEQFAQFERERGEGAERTVDHWQQSFELGAAAPAGLGKGTLTLLVRGAEMPGQARLLVFDDISEIVSAQRAQAWGEVARRLAHEIKNPLTPIQLSAERLALKLEGKLDEPEQAVLKKSVGTIVDQVDAMKRLVNEFRDYARLPAAELHPTDLNALANDVLQLYGGADAPRGPDAARIRLELDAACPPIQGDAQQLRQVIHNLLQNAEDATEGRPLREVTLRTRFNPASGRVRLIVQDTGSGFPEHILKRAFEPYVTTKAKGTGLGLAVVKKIADEHGARIDLSNRLEGDAVIGAQVSLSFASATAGAPA
ncbi:MAG: hypothetical protein RIQ96_2276 [Pseudomonadota bacterium]